MLTIFVIPVKFFQVIGRVFVRLSAFIKLKLEKKKTIFFSLTEVKRYKWN